MNLQPLIDNLHWIIAAFGLLIAEPAMAQELTANTPAVEPSLLSQIAEALWAAVAVLIGVFIRNAIPLLNAYLKQVMHFRGASVVADALTQVIAELSTELQVALADGKLDAAEMAALKMRARQIAEAKLKNLSGFYKSDLIGWIDDQLNIALAKLLARISV
jgi:predicted amidohydrolase